MTVNNSNIAVWKKCDFARILFWAASVIIVFWGIGGRGLWGSEDRWAEIVREMINSRDFFHPTLNGEPYFDKPLLSYWLIILTTFVSGDLNEWAIRFPSAVAGLLGLWATVRLGEKLWSKSIGLTAGWILHIHLLLSNLVIKI